MDNDIIYELPYYYNSVVSVIIKQVIDRQRLTVESLQKSTFGRFAASILNIGFSFDKEEISTGTE